MCWTLPNLSSWALNFLKIFKRVLFLDQKGNGQLMGRVRDLILSGQTGGQMLSVTAVWFGEESELNFHSTPLSEPSTGPEKAESVPK